MRNKCIAQLQYLPPIIICSEMSQSSSIQDVEGRIWEEWKWSIRSQRLEGLLIETWLLAFFPVAPWGVLYQRPRRTPVAHSNLVTKMSTIKGLICKAQDKARLYRHRTVQYFFLSVRQKERKQSAKTDRVAAETCLGRKLSRGLSPPSLPSLVSSSTDKIHKQRGP